MSQLHAFLTNRSFLRCLTVAIAGVCGGVGTAQAQLLIAGTTPMANARAASRTGTVAITFNQPLLASAGSALRVYSAQRGGLRSRGAATATVNGNALQFSPGTAAFLPGETVAATVTPAAASSTGNLARGRVFQFMAAVQGSGPAAFLAGTNLSVSGADFAEALGDVDGDGDLDLMVANGINSVTTRLNGGDASGSNTGAFSNGSAVTVGYSVYELVLGDVDGDGDLDLLTANYAGNGSVSVRLNGGDASGSNTGTFSGGTDVVVDGNASGLTLADVDGDGDLDLVAATTGAANVGLVSVRLNGGDASGSNTGTFSNGSTVLVTSSPYGMALGDVDGDGDLDLAATGYSDNLVSVRLNGGNASGTGSGTFSNGSDVNVGSNPMAVALGDADGDGDLDLVAANSLGNSVSVRLNGGNNQGGGLGTFGGGSTLAGVSGPRNVALADVDGDGDLDVVACGSNAVSVRPNQSALPLATTSGLASPPGGFTVAPTVAEGTAAPRYSYPGPLPGARLVIIDMQGRLVRDVALGSTAGLVPVEGLAAGWYVARLVAAGHQEVARFYLPE